VKSSSLSPLETEQVRTILRWRWIVLFAVIAFVFVVEILEHQEPTIHLAREFFVYGLVIPASIWLLLTLLARQMVQRASLSHNFERHRQFGQQLARCLDRDELARFITRFAYTSMPIDQAILFQYDHLKPQMEWVAEWNAHGWRSAPEGNRPTANARYAGQLAKMPGLHQACSCPLFLESRGKTDARQYCLPLVHDTMLVGLLRLRCLPNQLLSTEQTQFLNSISAQMALALALSIALPQQLTEAQQAERRRVAYDLHDSLAQQVGYLHLTLDRLASDERIAKMDWLRSDLNRLRKVANDCYRQIREYLVLPHNWDSTNLAQVIGGHIESIEPTVPFKVEYRTIGTSIRLESAVCQRILSLLQESLNNVQNHARARHVSVELTWRTDQLDMTVSDDGIGFDPVAAPEPGHYGMNIMRERIQELRGSMQIKSTPGGGTALQFQIPLRVARARSEVAED
jgi:signal transduction histidine kinase